MKLKQELLFHQIPRETKYLKWPDPIPKNNYFGTKCIKYGNNHCTFCLVILLAFCAVFFLDNSYLGNLWRFRAVAENDRVQEGSPVECDETDSAI